MSLTPEQWQQIIPLCRQVVDCDADSYGYVHDNSLRIEDAMCENDPTRFADGAPRIFDKEERSRLWRAAADKMRSPVHRATFIATFEEVKKATITRIERELGRPITNLQ